MHRIDGEGNIANAFTEGDPGTGTPATQVTEDWLNAVQEEIAGVIEGAGDTLDKPDNAQLYDAINTMITTYPTLTGKQVIHGMEFTIDSGMNKADSRTVPTNKATTAGHAYARFRLPIGATLTRVDAVAGYLQVAGSVTLKVYVRQYTSSTVSASNGFTTAYLNSNGASGDNFTVVGDVAAAGINRSNTTLVASPIVLTDSFVEVDVEIPNTVASADLVSLWSARIEYTIPRPAPTT